MYHSVGLVVGRVILNIEDARAYLFLLLILVARPDMITYAWQPKVSQPGI